jgi:hypothetical protein
MKLLFKNPNKRLTGECRSKLLDTDSELYCYIHSLKKKLRENGFPHNDRLDLHVEVLNDKEEPLSIFLDRVGCLEGLVIDVHKYELLGNAIIFKMNPITGYTNPHVTIAYFKDFEVTKKALTFLENL